MDRSAGAARAARPRDVGPSSPKTLSRVLLCAARTLNAAGQSRVSLSPRQEQLRAGCGSRQEERGPELRPKRCNVAGHAHATAAAARLPGHIRRVARGRAGDRHTGAPPGHSPPQGLRPMALPMLSSHTGVSQWLLPPPPTSVEARLS